MRLSLLSNPWTPALVAAAIGLAACGSASPRSAVSAPSTSAHNAPSTVAPGPAAGTGGGTSTTSGPPQPAASAGTTSTTTPPQVNDHGAITVSTPRPGAAVASPFTVAGTARVGGQTVQVQLTDGAGNVISQTSLHPQSDGSFSTSVRYAVPQPGPGTLVLFTSSGGARQNITQIPVQLGD